VDATDGRLVAGTSSGTSDVPAGGTGKVGEATSRDGAEEVAGTDRPDGDRHAGPAPQEERRRPRRAHRPADRPLFAGPFAWPAAERARARAELALTSLNDSRRGAVESLVSAITPVGCLSAMITLYVLVFGQLTWAQQSNFGTFGFDMGIYDQAIWLMSRFHQPFDTVRGLNYFGFHVNVISFALVPFYWLGAGPHFLYLVETLALAAGAIPLWLLARDRLADPWLALGPAAAYLLFPSIEWINWWHFHPDALAITPLFFAWWFATRRQWPWFWAMAALALSCKEDVALALAAMGVAVALRYGRRAGAWAAAVGVAWFAVCTRVVIPHYDGGQQAFYADFFPTLGRSLPQVLGTIVHHPSRVYSVMARKNRRTYYIQLLSPVAFVPLIGGWAALLVAMPQLVVNTVGSIGYTHDIHFHYSALVIVGVMLGTVESLGARTRRFGSRAAWVVVLVAAALAANVAWSPSPISVHFHNGEWAVPSAESRAEAAAVAQVRDGAGVSASYTIVPHLTHRTHIYEWPNPFRTGNWGIGDRHPDPPSNVEWLVLDTNLNQDTAPLISQLTSSSGPFRVVFAQRTLIVAHRVTG
jgi:uncharacterized membrane protein